MRLYLSSAGVGNHLTKLVEMVGDRRKMLYVNNAKDYLPKRVRDEHSAEKKEEFESYGFDFYELDLREYFVPQKREVLSQILAETDLLWIGGGNTFVLRRAFRQSGLDELLPGLLKADTFVYGGSSAGAIVMTKTLRGAEHGDDPYTVPNSYDAEIIWDGLGLVYPQLAVHVGSDWFGAEAQAMIDSFETNGLKYESLQDGEVYIIDGEYEEKLT